MRPKLGCYISRFSMYRHNQQSIKRVRLTTPNLLMTGLSETCPFGAGPGMAGLSHFSPFRVLDTSLTGSGPVYMNE